MVSNCPRCGADGAVVVPLLVPELQPTSSSNPKAATVRGRVRGAMTYLARRATPAKGRQHTITDEGAKS